MERDGSGGAGSSNTLLAFVLGAIVVALVVFGYLIFGGTAERDLNQSETPPAATGEPAPPTAPVTEEPATPGTGNEVAPSPDDQTEAPADESVTPPDESEAPADDTTPPDEEPATPPSQDR